MCQKCVLCPCLWPLAPIIIVQCKDDDSMLASSWYFLFFFGIYKRSCLISTYAHIVRNLTLQTECVAVADSRTNPQLICFVHLLWGVLVIFIWTMLNTMQPAMANWPCKQIASSWPTAGMLQWPVPCRATGDPRISKMHAAGRGGRGRPTCMPLPARKSLQIIHRFIAWPHTVTSFCVN